MKKIMLLATAALQLTIACAQEKTIAERLGYPKNTKLLILHADDLGVSHSENEASINIMEKGCVNSASIMVPCPWFTEIAAYAREHPGKDFGLHITLTSEWTNYKWGPVTSSQVVPTLINKQGYLYASVDSVLQFASAAQVEVEIRNQVKRAIQFGIDPTHLDTHMGTVARKLDFLKAYIKVGREFKIPVFVPRQIESGLNIRLDTLMSKGEVVVESLVTILPQQMQSNAVDFYTNALRNLPSGLTYFIIHTAYDTEEMKAVTKGFVDWGSAWRQTDYNFFSSPQCAKLLKENNIQLVTWREIRDKLYR
ncbi:hypothetical protein A3860_38265 [Niastella vici]|uniref:ChbG/HpnK family deacetylase n=1 Tax=Niastella vici TaxID=1703345 RepID=A0A1V9FLK2_9BACT|nr:polysaccharide deacetylase family protein [Niastella vici]OQP59229.1 hypothetical protein A3860_38265 [Niastella vici]